MILETDRLFLRELTYDDFDALYAVLADSDMMKHYPYTFDESRVRNWITRNMDRYQKYGFGLWAVVLKETGEMIGDCGITMQPINGQWLPEIGYHIRADHQRKGYASEAAAACVRYAFAHYDFPAVYCYMKYTNIPSQKTAMRIGMTFVEEYPDPDNIYTRVYAIHRTEWEDQHESFSGNRHHGYSRHKGNADGFECADVKISLITKVSKVYQTGTQLGRFFASRLSAFS